MIGYVTLGTDDLDRSRTYFDELFATIGAKRVLQLENPGGFTMYGTAPNRPGIVLTKPYDGQPSQVGNGILFGIPVDS